MPQNANVFIFEDSEIQIELIKNFLEQEGHIVVGIASTMKSALESIPTLTDLGVEVATLDANLTKGESNGYEGQRILSEIKKLYPRIKTIGMSSQKFPGTDFDLGKHPFEDLIGLVVTRI